MPDTIHYWFMKEIKLYGVALCDTEHFDHVTSYFFLCPLLYDVALSDSVIVNCSNFGYVLVFCNLMLELQLHSYKKGDSLE